MKLLPQTLTSILLISSLFTTPSTSETKSIKIRSETRPIILFQKFGFTNSGNATVSVSGVSVTSTLSQPDLSRLAFFLLSEQSLFQILLELQQNPYFCIVDSKFIIPLFNFGDLYPSPHNSFYELSYPVTNSNEYSLFFANCNPESLVTMDVRTEMFNTGDNATKDYLSDGLTQLPSLYFIFSVIYLCFLGFWISLCFKNRQCVHRAHLLMGALLTMKTVTIFCSAMDKYYIKVTGTPHGWSVLFHILNSITVTLLFTAIILISAGWPFSKPILQEKGKRVLMIVIPLQVLATAASIVIGETGPYIADWVTWNQVYLLADFICCCAVIFSIVRSVRAFSKTDRIRNLTVFRLFCVVVIGYLLFTRIGVFALKTIGSYKYQWVWFGVEEMVSFVFCLVMFYMFRPVKDDGYTFVEDECEESLEVVKG